VLKIDRAEKIRLKPLNKSKVSSKDMLFFCEQMEATQRIQMSRLTALDLCIETAEGKNFKLMLAAMRKSITDGGSLYEAMKRFPNAFDDLVLGLVKAGEDAGALDRSFAQIKTIVRRGIAMKKKIIGLLIFPAITMTIATGVIFIIVFKTVPAFTGLFRSAGMKLPMPTQMLVYLSDFVIKYPIPVIGGIITGLGLLWNLPVICKKNPVTHKWMIKLPVIGTIQRKMVQATFCRTLAQMIKAQMPLIAALTLCRTVSNNYEFRASIARGTIKVSKGNPMMPSFEPEADILSLRLVRFLGFGESTGKTEDVLHPISEVLDEEANEYIENIRVLMEPLMTIIIGSVVLFIMLALFLPIFDLPKLIK